MSSVFRWNATGGDLSKRIASFEELLAAWQIYDDQLVSTRSALHDKERDVNAFVLQRDAAESTQQHVDRAKVRHVVLLTPEMWVGTA